MLDLGATLGRTCRGRLRRAFLKAGTLGVLGLTPGDLLALRARAGPMAAAPKARSVIVLWLRGGPSHLDTFDPKPDAPLEYRGPFESITTAAPGVRICELLPGLARRADRIALVRSMHHESNDHGVAGTIALTGGIGGAIDLGGQVAGGPLKPSTGAIVAWLADRRPGELPPYVILGNPLHQGHKRVVGEGGGMLGAVCDPFRVDYEPEVGLVLPEVRLPDGVAAGRMAARWELFDRVAPPGADPGPGPSRASGSMTPWPAGRSPRAKAWRHWRSTASPTGSRTPTARIAPRVGRSPAADPTAGIQVLRRRIRRTSRTIGLLALSARCG